MTKKEITDKLEFMESLVGHGREGRPESQQGEFADGWDKGFNDCLGLVRSYLELD